VIDGLPADVVALALPLDVQKICDAGLLREDWRKRFPLQSVGAPWRAYSRGPFELKAWALAAVLAAVSGQRR
jgi:ABC-type sulfate transport system substrate-binding protein